MLIQTQVSKERSQHEVGDRGLLLFCEHTDPKWWTMQRMSVKYILKDWLALFVRQLILDNGMDQVIHDAKQCTYLLIGILLLVAELKVDEVKV